MSKNKNKKKKLVVAVLVLTLTALILVVGLSYAWFQTSEIGEINVIQVSDGIKLEIKNEKTITLTDTLPMTDAFASTIENLNIYEFDFVSTDLVDYDYVFGMEHLDTSLPPQYLRYSIKEGDKEWTDPDYMTNFVYSGTIKAGETLNFKIKVWVAKETNNDFQTKNYEGQLNIAIDQTNKPKTTD